MTLTEWIISIMNNWVISVLPYSCSLTMSSPNPLRNHHALGWLFCPPKVNYSSLVSLFQVVSVLLLAAALLYWIGYKFKHESIFHFVDRYGKYLFIKSADVKKSLAWFEQYGHRIVFLAG